MELESQLEDLKQTLDTMRRQLSGTPALLPEEVEDALTPLRYKIAALEEQIQAERRTTYHIHVEHAEGLAIGDQAKIALARLDRMAAGLDGDTALARYLDHIVEDNRCLRLQGIRSAKGLVRIELEDVYITLSVEQQANVKIQAALARYPRLVVLGSPGCGKTTLLRYLALTYARDLREGLNLVKQRLELAESRVPVLFPLRDFARYLQSKHPDSSTDGPKLLLDYLHVYFDNQNIHLPGDFFAERLEQGECVVLLDGEDEVADLPARNRVSRMIERFTISYPTNRYVVTSRIVGYTGSARLDENYQVTTVRDFTWDDFQRFMTSWGRAVEIALAGNETTYTLREADRQTGDLLRAIESNERVLELAVNPLLLTVIALVQRYRAQLPERRTELYEEAVEVLLGKWDEAKGLPTTRVIAGRKVDSGDRRSLLEPIALWMMEQKVWEIEADELRRQLGKPFYEMIGDWRQVGKAVDQFLQLVNERSGLLAERGQGVYAFSHLTFQEYLAARSVADREDYIAYTLTHLPDSWWREVILLEAGYLSTQGKRRVTALVQAIMNHRIEPKPYHNLVLAAECLRDVGPVRIEGDLWGEGQRRLRKVFERPLRHPPKSIWQNFLSHVPDLPELIESRTVAAQTLARMEDGVPGANRSFWQLPYGEPAWVDVPAGEFCMGNDKTSSDKSPTDQLHGDEHPAHRLYLERFQIARVPVTNAQYHLFVEATGYRAPGYWGDVRPPRGLESFPVVMVTWYDAMAYCRWLSKVTGKLITLPSEAQWEKAARGDRSYCEYPWGDEWNEGKCNTKELALGRTTPVGIFPEGAGPYGCLDMAGNVWEWTRSLWKSYPYDPNDGREAFITKDVIRVLKGGSWGYDRNWARCACRYKFLPGYFDLDWGFRCCMLPKACPNVDQ